MLRHERRDGGGRAHVASVSRAFLATRCGAVLAAVAASAAIAVPASLVPAAPANAFEVGYCYVSVPPYTDCANASGGSWYNGYFSANQADVYEGSGGFNVCEHTYIAGTGDTVSDRCGPMPEDSGCDLDWYYANGYELSGHAGNNYPFYLIITGYAYDNSCV